jgi:transposase
MRRTHLRTHGKILKRLLVHVAGFNLSLVMRRLFGIGKPRQLQDGLAAAILGLFDPMLRLLEAYGHLLRRLQPVYVVAEPIPGLRAAA